MTMIFVNAKTENLNILLSSIDECMRMAGMSKDLRTRAMLVAEEVFVNIAHHAYNGGEGHAIIKCNIIQEPPGIMLEFIDSGVHFNPLEQGDPDTSLPAEKREIGGLGIYITKRIANEIYYWRKDGANHLAMVLLV